MLLVGRAGCALAHVILQDAIYHELRTIAARQNSQLIVATHSEVVINSVEPREFCVMLNEAANDCGQLRP